jgi:hypothetical protein
MPGAGGADRNCSSAAVGDAPEDELLELLDELLEESGVQGAGT